MCNLSGKTWSPRRPSQYAVVTLSWQDFSHFPLNFHQIAERVGEKGRDNERKGRGMMKGEVRGNKKGGRVVEERGER